MASLPSPQKLPPSSQQLQQPPPLPQQLGLGSGSQVSPLSNLQSESLQNDAPDKINGQTTYDEYSATTANEQPGPGIDPSTGLPLELQQQQEFPPSQQSQIQHNMEMDQTYECFGSGAELGQDGYITSMNFLSDPGHPLPAISDRTALQVVPSSDSLTFTGTPYSGYIPAPNSAECEESHRTEVMSLPPPLPSFDDTVQFQMLYGMDSNPGLDGPSYTNYFGDGYPRYVVAGGGYCCNNGSSCGYFVKAEERSNAGNKCDDSKTYGGTYTETKTNSSHQPPLHGYGNEEKESEYEEEEDYEEDEEEEDDGDSGNNGSKLVDETKSKKKTKAVPNDLSSHEKKIRGPRSNDYIQDSRKRGASFCKRRDGLMKKFCEIAKITGSEGFIMIRSPTGMLFWGSTSKMETIAQMKEVTDWFLSQAPPPIPRKPRRPNKTKKDEAK